jgi:deoxyribose-phosphate aldolase
MNAKHLIAALTVFAAAGAALADDTTYPYVDHSKFVSTKTRAEVIAELNAANANGQLAQNPDFVEFPAVASTKTRAEVRAELEKAYADGQYAANRTPEFVEFTNVASTKTRDEVRQEAIATSKQNHGTSGE